MLEILQGLQYCSVNKERAVLATIVDVDGSAYRREGARCLIMESGQVIGSLSGGCVEGDLLEYAIAVMDTGIPQEIRYEFRSEDDMIWGLGMGCTGGLKIWLQAVDFIRYPEQGEQLIQAFEKRVSCRNPYKSGLVLESSDPGAVAPGTYLVLDQGSGNLNTDSHRVKSGVENGTVHGIFVKMLVETIQPRPRLVIFGASAGAAPIVEGAKSLQWHVAVIDHREHYLNQGTFLKADECILTSRSLYADCYDTDDAYVVVMTHSYELDKMLVQTLLPSSVPYLGVLGSRNRIERILGDIRQEDGEWSIETLEKLHSPIGLDIGADSPEEIALSILSELVCRKNGRNGQSLRMRKEPLHERQDTVSITPVKQ